MTAVERIKREAKAAVTWAGELVGGCTLSAYRHGYADGLRAAERMARRAADAERFREFVGGYQSAAPQAAPVPPPPPSPVPPNRVIREGDDQ